MLLPSIARFAAPGPLIVRSSCLTGISPLVSEILLFAHAAKPVRPLRSTVSPDAAFEMTSRSVSGPLSSHEVTGRIAPAIAAGALNANNDAMQAASGLRRAV